MNANWRRFLALVVALWIFTAVCFIAQADALSRMNLIGLLGFQGIDQHAPAYMLGEHDLITTELVNQIQESMGLPETGDKTLISEVLYNHLNIIPHDTRTLTKATLWYNGTLFFYEALASSDVADVWPGNLFAAIGEYDKANGASYTQVDEDGRGGYYSGSEELGLWGLLGDMRTGYGTDESVEALADALAVIAGGTESAARDPREAIADLIMFLTFDNGLSLDDTLPDSMASLVKYFGPSFEDKVKARIEQTIVNPVYPPTYEEGYDDGEEDGYNDGYDNGYPDGVEDGFEDGYENGKNSVTPDPEDGSYNEGFEDGKNSVVPEVIISEDIVYAEGGGGSSGCSASGSGLLVGGLLLATTLMASTDKRGKH
jgi:hypothetical protein